MESSYLSISSVITRHLAAKIQQMSRFKFKIRSPNYSPHNNHVYGYSLAHAGTAAASESLATA